MEGIVMLSYNKLLRYCVNELEGGIVSLHWHDFWKCKLEGRMGMEERYNTLSDKQKIASYCILAAYNAAFDCENYSAALNELSAIDSESLVFDTVDYEQVQSRFFEALKKAKDALFDVECDV